MTDGDDRAMWFQDGAALYCRATGANAMVQNVVVGAKFQLVTELRATPAELGEVVSRLISGARVPQFPNEVTNAIVTELRDLREQRARRARPDAADAQHAPRAASCLLCGDTGLVTVPHRWCIWDRRISCGRRTQNQFRYGAVLCDRPGCEPGQRARDDESRRECGRRGPRRSILRQIIQSISAAGPALSFRPERWRRRTR